VCEGEDEWNYREGKACRRTGKGGGAGHGAPLYGEKKKLLGGGKVSGLLLGEKGKGENGCLLTGEEKLGTRRFSSG